MNNGRGIMATVVAGHFVAAFAALGMPPFFPLLLQGFGGTAPDYLAGWCYVLPSVCLAVSSPWWGRAADRFGHKALLLRAQLGLAGSFLLAGFADSVEVFVLALALQGLLGGTFGASSAYLATLTDGERLARGLTLMQGSARAALVLAPLLLGVAAKWLSPLILYRYLALLPLFATLMIWRLPSTTPLHRPEQAADSAVPRLGPLLLLQGVFVFATVVTFPYFVVFAQSRTGIASTAIAGFLFGLPHLVYLVAAAPLTRALRSVGPQRIFMPALVVLLVSLAGHPSADSSVELGLWRLMMGLAMTAGFIGLHGLAAAAAGGGRVGRMFGRLESGSKWGAVIAGVAAGVVMASHGPAMPFYLGAAVLAAALCVMCASRFRSRRTSFEGAS